MSSKHHVFNYWYIADADGHIETEIYPTETVACQDNHTLTAEWITARLMYFDPNGGEVDLEWRNTAFGKKYPGLPTPTREGYTFVGWFFGGDNEYTGTQCVRSDDLIVLPEHPDTVIAHWIPAEESAE